MKTLGRILIILVATALVSGAMYMIFNGAGTGTNSGFERQEGRFQSGGNLPNGIRPDFEGERMERGESGEHGVGNWSGMLGHLSVIALITTVVVLLQRLFKPRKMVVSVSPGGSA
jgi:hypothetical protein